MKFYEDLELNASWLLAGFLGSLVAILQIPAGEMSLRRALASLLGGLACAHYGPELVIAFSGLESDSGYTRGIAFILGLLGLKITAAIYNIDVKAIIQNRLGGGE